MLVLSRKENESCEAGVKRSYGGEIERLRAEIERLRDDLTECKRLLRFVCDNAHRNAGTDINPFTYLWQKQWDEFELATKKAGGGDE